MNVKIIYVDCSTVHWNISVVLFQCHSTESQSFSPSNFFSKDRNVKSKIFFMMCVCTIQKISLFCSKEKVTGLIP